METKDLQIDITKAIDNAYLRELQYKTHDERTQSILKDTYPQTQVDKTVGQFLVKFFYVY